MRAASVPVEMREMKMSGAGSAKQERKTTEAEADCETD
jgi:hypothetical protein